MTKTVADNVALICKDRLDLNDVSKHLSLNLPAVRVKNLRQIIIHPDSSIKGKNWSPRKYLKLARQLRDANCDIVFLFRLRSMLNCAALLIISLR